MSTTEGKMRSGVHAKLLMMREDKSNAQSDVQIIDAQVKHLSSRIGM